MTTEIENQFTFDEVRQQLGNTIPAELLEIFREEAEDHLGTIYDGLARLKSDSADLAALADVRRSAHTLKGAAGAVNLVSATRLAHRMEDLLDQLAERNDAVTESQLVLLLTTADQLQDLTGGEIEAEATAHRMVDLYRRYSSEIDGGLPCHREAQSQSETGSESLEDHRISKDNLNSTHPVTSVSVAEGAVCSEKPPSPFLRVPLDRLDELVNVLGEMVVNRSEFQHHLHEFEARIEDMQSTMERLRDVTHFVQNSQNKTSIIDHSSTQSPRTAASVMSGRTCDLQHRVNWEHPSTTRSDFDLLEFEQFDDFHSLMQTLAESETDAEMMAAEFRKVKSAFSNLLRRQQQLNREAQNGLMKIRMVPLAGIVGRLERVVRTVSQKLDKQVELVVVGDRIELDKTVLDAITDPLLHLVRNAIDHGVESGAERAEAGKHPIAKITLTAVNRGTQVSLRLADDGGGIRLDKVRQKAVDQHLIDPAQTVSSDELHRLIFQPGFSTAGKLTDVSGRGVGMDVVGDAIRRLKGSIRVESQPGNGTTFSIHLPTSLGVSRAVMVEAAGETFAIPLASIQQSGRLDPQSVTHDDGEIMTIVGDRQVRLIDLAEYLGLSKSSNTTFEKISPTLVLSNGLDEVVVAVDTILGTEDVVIQSLGDHLKKVRGILGATLGGDGSVIPILDSNELTERHDPEMLDWSDQSSGATSDLRRKLAMVIDDSISVRRVTENLLKIAGWDVVTAQDGVDALQRLSELDSAPDVFLCDMEMPRMDGLELIRQIREQTEFESTPIVMVTSRSSEKHRQKAFEAGASDFVVKPFDSERLLELITELVQTARETVVV